jgi:hypothetical protein
MQGALQHGRNKRKNFPICKRHRIGTLMNYDKIMGKEGLQLLNDIRTSYYGVPRIPNASQ